MPVSSEERSLIRRQNLFDKVLKTGINIKEIKRLDIKEYNKLMGTKVKKKASLLAQHRLLDQLNYYVQDVSKYHIKKNQIINENYKRFVNEEGRRLVQKEGDYTVLEIRYTKDDSRWIKFKDKKGLAEQLKKLEASYGKNYELFFYDFKKYASFIEKQFDKITRNKGIIV